MSETGFMATYTQLYVHLVWGTWNRLPLITTVGEVQLYTVLATKCKECGCTSLAIGGVSDHVHMLVEFSTTISIAQLVRAMKGASSHAMTHLIAPQAFFKWQGDYGAFSVSKSLVSKIKAYISHQKSYHAEGTCIPELEIP